MMIVVSSITYIFFHSLELTLIVLGCGTVLVQFIAFLINEYDKKKKTGIKCKLCLYDDCVLFYPANKRKVSTKDDFGSFSCSSFDHGKHSDIYYCPMCKNGFLKDIGSSDFEKTKEIGYELYEDVVDEEYIRNIEARHMAFRNVVEKYNEYFKEKRVLEVGCYYGAFHDVVKDTAASYTGIEPSKHACNHIRGNNPGAEILNGNVESVINAGMLEGKEFDTICMYDVIEHVPDPIKMIQMLHKYLKPGGHLIFSTINIEASLSLALGHKWPWYMDMHYYYFSDRGYVDMLSRSGYGLKTHAHFPYVVKAHYFVRKAMAVFLFPINLPKFIHNLLDFTIPIKFGDVVLIIGRKEVE